MDKVWSQYSLDIFDFWENNEENLIVKACPGAGKTTNIERLWSLDDKPTVYLVFNKHNQVEASNKLPPKSGSAVLTLNSLGARCIYNTLGKVKLNERKTLDIIKRVYPGKTNESREEQYVISKIVTAAKCIDVGGTFNREMYEDIVNTYDFDVSKDLYSQCEYVLGASDRDTSQIDFADQLRFPVIYDCAVPQYHNVLGDEVQDFNPIQAALIAKLNAQRYGLVGDAHQSIYGFKGAMNNSMELLKAQFHCVELPLSITYRCAKSVVSEAYAVYPDIQPWEQSPQGLVRKGGEKEDYVESDIVLCRTNRPLIQMAYDLLRNGTPCHVRGRDIGDGLIKLIERQGCSTVGELITRLNEEYEVEMTKAIAREDDAKQQRLTDRYSSALLFCGKATLRDNPSVVVDAINSLFEQGKGVVLSTVHKAKGLEASRAFLLNTSLFDSFASKAKQSWQREQERNIKYVAITRAKNELVYM